MDSLQPCPCCLSDVNVIEVERHNSIGQKFDFLVRCNHCGKATARAYPSKRVLAAIWNTMVLENQRAC